jgi:hypothetical protein
LWKAGRSIFRRTFRPWKWLDIPLRSVKYNLLALFLWAVGSMSPAAIRAFLEGLGAGEKFPSSARLE